MKPDKHLMNLEGVLRNILPSIPNSGVREDKIKFSSKLIESGRIKKVAFDAYRVENDPYKDLWILDTIDGVQHLVRASDPTTEFVAKGAWEAISDSEKQNVTLAYKGKPISRFSSKEYGFTGEDIFMFKEALLDSTQDDSFVTSIFDSQPADKRKAFAESHPELKKFMKE